MKHEGNNPKRRIAEPDYFTRNQLDGFVKAAHYRGSAHHKSEPADYDFHPPVSPRAKKSVCDKTRIILKGEAKQLLMSGFARGMVSTFRQGNLNLPKFVWAVDNDDMVYEAKIDRNNPGYYGYELYGKDKDMRKRVLKEWKRRSN